MGGGVLVDAGELLDDGIPPGDDLDAWDPEHIQRTLPLLKALVFGTYFRGEVRGLENIPADGPALLVGNHSGGTMIADTFVFSAALLRALRARPALPPARPQRRRAHARARPDPPLRDARRRRTRTRGARSSSGAPVLVYPGGDYETFRPIDATQTRSSSAAARGSSSSRSRRACRSCPVVSIGGQETALFVTRGETAARVTGLREARAHQGAAGVDRAAVRDQRAGPAGPAAAAGEDHDPGDAAGRPEASASARSRTPRTVYEELTGRDAGRARRSVGGAHAAAGGLRPDSRALL